MPPILLAVFHCSLYRERISSWGAAGLFQFPLLREGRRGKSCTTSSFLRFQFTLLREGRLPTVCHASPPKAFQFTPLREGRLVHFNFIRAIYNFNSRPSARGDVRVLVAAIIGAISIHAPPRGATFLLSVVRPSSTISIHAPPRGATQHSSWYGYYYAIISIHAPPRGATWKPQNLRK